MTNEPSKPTPPVTDVSYLLKSTLYPISYFAGFFIPVAVHTQLQQLKLDAITLSMIVILPLLYMLVGAYLSRTMLKTHTVFMGIALVLTFISLPDGTGTFIEKTVVIWPWMITVLYGLSFCVYLVGNLRHNRKIIKAYQEKLSEQKNKDEH